MVVDPTANECYSVGEPQHCGVCALPRARTIKCTGCPKLLCDKCWIELGDQEHGKVCRPCWGSFLQAAAVDETADQTYCRLSNEYANAVKLAFAQGSGMPSHVGEAMFEDEERAFFDYAKDNFKAFSKHNAEHYLIAATMDGRVSYNEVEAAARSAIEREGPYHPKAVIRLDEEE
jgi:hypothetical protein